MTPQSQTQETTSSARTAANRWRLQVVHRTRFHYTGPVRSSYNEARLTPESSNRQTTLRSRVGGRLDCFSCDRRTKVRHSMWQRLTSLNLHHMGYAWASLITVTLADVYVRLVATGAIIDPAIHF